LRMFFVQLRIAPETPKPQNPKPQNPKTPVSQL